MSAELISILALAAMFVVATLLPINMGVLAFSAAFLVGTLAGGLTTDEILGDSRARSSSCSSAITYLFAHRQGQRHHRLAGPAVGPRGARPAGRHPVGDVRASPAR